MPSASKIRTKYPDRRPVEPLRRVRETSPSQTAAQVQTPDDLLLRTLLERGKSGYGRLSFSRDEEDSFVQHVIRFMEDIWAQNAPYVRNMVEMQKNWRGTTDPKDFPFEGSANLRQPLTSVQVEQMKARIKKAVLGDDQLISEVRGWDNTIDPKELADMSQWFDYELRETVDLDKALDDIIHDMLVVGLGMPFVMYEHRTRVLHSMYKEKLGSEDVPSEMAKMMERIISEPSNWGTDDTFGDGPDNLPKQPKQGIFEWDNGDRIVFSLKLTGNTPTLHADVWRRSTIFDGVKCKTISLEDLACPNTTPEIDDLPGMGIRCWLSIPDYRQGLQDGTWISYGDEEDLRIAEMASFRDPEYMDMPFTRQQDEEEGQDSRDLQGVDITRQFLEVYRWEGWWVPGQSFAESNQRDKALLPAIQVVGWVSPQSRRLLRIERLEDMNKDGKRSGIKFGFLEEPRRFFPMGLAEWLRHSQTELDIVHNLRLDAGVIMNVGFGFYEPASGFGKDIFRLEPGKMYPVKNPQHINFPKTNYNAAVSFNDEQLIRRYAGEQGGISEQSTGVPVSKRQSASEFVGTSAALDLRTEQLVIRFMRSLRELLYRIFGLYQQFGPTGRLFRTSGQEGVSVTKLFEMDRLQGRFYLKLMGTPQQVNGQLERQLATDMLQLLLNEVLVQTGMVTPQTIYDAVHLLMKTMHLDHRIKLNKPDVPAQSDSPSEENKQLLLGHATIGPTPTENFNEHIQAHMSFMSDPNFSSMLTPASMKRFQDHIMKTTQMQQAVAMIKQQQAAMAVQMASTMAAKGIQPGMPGGGAGGGAGGQPPRAARPAEVSQNKPMAPQMGMPQ